jgi:glycine cleavage system regulatory protein
VITVLGEDRPGLVDRLSRWVAEAEGDWLDSQLRHIGHQFAGILQVSTPAAQAESFENQAPEVSAETGLRITMAAAGAAASEGTLFSLTCMGQDRPGIVKALTDILLAFRANVESLETVYQDAPMAGGQLFEARFQVRLPEDVDFQLLEQRLTGIGEELMLDVQVSA